RAPGRPSGTSCRDDPGLPASPAPPDRDLACARPPRAPQGARASAGRDTATVPEAGLQAALSSTSAPVRAPGAVESSSSALQAASVLAIGAGFAYIAFEAWRQVERLLWRPWELIRMLEAAGTLVTSFPGRSVALLLVGVGVLLVAEYRPRLLLDLAVRFWLVLGGAGLAAYFLSTF